MRKLLMFLAASALLALPACSGGDTSSSSSTTETAKPDSAATPSASKPASETAAKTDAAPEKPDEHDGHDHGKAKNPDDMSPEELVAAIPAPQREYTEDIKRRHRIPAPKKSPELYELGWVNKEIPQKQLEVVHHPLVGKR